MIDLVRGPLPIHFFTIVVKVSAVDRVYPNARDRFMAAFGATSFNRSLFGLSVMGPESVEDRLENLNEFGIVPGVDVAVACMGRGPLLECPGVIFRCEGEAFDARWTADVGEASVAIQAAAQDAPTGPIQRLDTEPAHGPSPEAQAAPSAPSQLWRRHARPGGLVFWTGGDDDVECVDVAHIPTPPLAGEVKVAPVDTHQPIVFDTQTAECHYKALDAHLTDILANTNLEYDSYMIALLQAYERRLRVALELPAPKLH